MSFQPTSSFWLGLFQIHAIYYEKYQSLLYSHIERDVYKNKKYNIAITARLILCDHPHQIPNVFLQYLRSVRIIGRF